MNADVVCTVCHGPASFANVKLSDGSFMVKGKKVLLDCLLTVQLWVYCASVTRVRACINIHCVKQGLLLL